MSGDRIAQDFVGTLNGRCYCPSQRKRIGLALTLVAFILCTTLATGRPVPRQTATQTMKLLKGREREEQVLQTEICSASLSSSAIPSWSLRLSRSVIDMSMSKGKEKKMGTREERRLSGLGSHPPSCKSKCGRCVPCNPVHVPIHPGRNRAMEYYPEAWRCKCGNKLYMP